MWRVYVGCNFCGLVMIADLKLVYVVLMGDGCIVIFDLVMGVVGLLGWIGGGTCYLNLLFDGCWLYVMFNEECGVVKVVMLIFMVVV